MEIMSQEELKLLALEFNLFDSRGSQELTRDNVVKLFKHLNPRIAEWEIDRLITTYDTNQDGLFQLKEFIMVRHKYVAASSMAKTKRRSGR